MGDTCSTCNTCTTCCTEENPKPCVPENTKTEINELVSKEMKNFEESKKFFSKHVFIYLNCR